MAIIANSHLNAGVIPVVTACVAIGTPTSIRPPLISLMVSVDVKHYERTTGPQTRAVRSAGVVRIALDEARLGVVRRA